MDRRQIPPTGASSERELAFDRLAERFEHHGGTDLGYLRRHHARFLTTLATFDRSWDRRRGVRVLDVGAHWLHQALMWRIAGYAVTALDLPPTFEQPSVQALAEAEGIRLLANDDLERCPALRNEPDDAFDVVLFTEILEHLTFNPVRFWREIHRVLAPGGRIVITTPNAYAWHGRAWRWWRFVRGRGYGIGVDEILGTPTGGAHWKEYSRREIVAYFRRLSPDFAVVAARTLPQRSLPGSAGWRRLVRGAFEAVPPLRSIVYAEVELTAKRHGIVLEPRW